MNVWINIWPLAILLGAILIGWVLPVKYLRTFNGLVIVLMMASLFMPLWHLFRPVDALAYWFDITATVFGAFAIWFSGPYIAVESGLHDWDEHRVKGYYLGLYTFVGSLMAMALLANYLLLWVALEVATLSSIYLVQTSGTRTSLEAAWRYLVVTESGGLAGLLGTILILVGSARNLGTWGLMPASTSLPVNSTMVLAGIILAAVGYGAKAGLAPFHTWLPDAHSEAPAPVSALLSGVKLAGAVLILDRLFSLSSGAVPAAWPHDLLWILGLLSLIIAASFVAFQKDLKRLWAYSSIEHIGLIALGLGFGGLGVLGALLHVWTHAINKTLLFYNAGTVRLYYHGVSSLPDTSGLLESSPYTGGLLALGATGIVGLPPFAPFWSEWLILMGGIAQGHVVVTIVAIILLLAIFGGITLKMPRWLFTPGESRKNRVHEPWRLILPSMTLGVLVVIGGIALPGLLPHMFHHAAAILRYTSPSRVVMPKNS
ncbi:proton-conducting transporter membrane subunit [Sulfobacillus thermosulfidooxidans]|uniref:Nitroreductase family protein n=1 Tax=Sulfobacillus thermosulfidooxidans TaxID=28034 RepID=A0A1R0IKJ0_SULTH|nr:proton-conducting transporter membrane subunit [Sulfobacillus thermosulfidooxidans]OLZ10520.1 hypothetical protein BFX05_01420 [Sulfobacillus thermosulfidooxidans]OLZ14224.1 hypothetical protein BFX06_08000 [Sulfobacillus thermosulfidooxidans]OLZ18967.1 hypothetical protein BFX07_04395 [Sulfobacillus thermosulfidooxidans]PSR25083.1 MAG: nitroreductase family protein [Sulfobacillus thermosulfidooxidans]